MYDNVPIEIWLYILEHLIFLQKKYYNMNAGPNEKDVRIFGHLQSDLIAFMLTCKEFFKMINLYTYSSYGFSNIFWYMIKDYNYDDIDRYICKTHCIYFNFKHAYKLNIIYYNDNKKSYYDDDKNFYIMTGKYIFSTIVEEVKKVQEEKQDNILLPPILMQQDDIAINNVQHEHIRKNKSKQCHESKKYYKYFYYSNKKQHKTTYSTYCINNKNNKNNKNKKNKKEYFVYRKKYYTINYKYGNNNNKITHINNNNKYKCYRLEWRKKVQN